MQASETTFQTIIEGTKQYIVPLFQRRYTWQKKEWTALWEDLISLYENETPKSHFVGSIVTVQAVSSPTEVTKYVLIDGQQRLTTIFILLTVMRDHANASGSPELAEEIEKTMLVNPYRKGTDRFKLLPTQVDHDRDYFMALILNASASDDLDAASMIRQCYQFFERKLLEYRPALTQLKTIIMSRLSVVSIMLGQDDNPYLVFESLNAKGQKLAESDLIRNYFFMQMAVEEQDEIHAQYWAPMQSALGGSLTEFIRHYLMRNGSIVKKDDVYFTLKDRVGRREQALGMLMDLARFAEYYEHFVSPATEPDPDLQYALGRLKRLDVTTVYPFLLNCYDDYAQGRIAGDALYTILGLIENYIVRRFVCNIPTSQLNKMFPALYEQAQRTSPANLVNGVRQILQKRGYPKNAEFSRRLIDARLYVGGERAIKTKLILEALESAYEHREPVRFDDSITIEHIMPQTLTDAWRHELGDDWQTDHELLLHTIGNLTLTGYNSELSNAPYQKKKAALAISHFELNRYFQTVPIWNRAEIERRSEALAEVARYVWPYFGEEVEIPADRDHVTGQTPVSVTILGQTFEVKSWVDVQQKTLNTIADLEPDLFTELAATYPRFISSDAEIFRRSRRLDNGFYVEINLSAKNVYQFCTQAIETIGLSNEDWKVETRSTA